MLAPRLGRFGYVGRTRFHIFWHRLCAKTGHWVVSLFSKACLTPLPFSLLLCVDIATLLSVLSLKPHGDISAHSCWSIFNLNQWSLLKVILGRMMLHAFFPKTSYGNELNQCGWSHCAQFAKTQKMICILTLFGHHLTLSSRVLRPYSDLKVSVSTNTCFDGYRRKKHNGVRIIVPTRAL